MAISCVITVDRCIREDKLLCEAFGEEWERRCWWVQWRLVPWTMSSKSLGFSLTFYPEIQARLLRLAFDIPSFPSTSVFAILYVPAWLTPMIEKLPEGTLGSPLQGVTTSLETPSQKPHLLFSALLNKRFIVHPHSFRLPSALASA